MSIWTHPTRHFGFVHEWLQVGVPDHHIGGNDSSICGVAGRLWIVRFANDDLPNETFDAVCADDKVAFDHLASGERDGGARCGGGVGVHGFDGRFEADFDTGRGFHQGVY